MTARKNKLKNLEKITITKIVITRDRDNQCSKLMDLVDSFHPVSLFSPNIVHIINSALKPVSDGEEEEPNYDMLSFRVGEYAEGMKEGEDLCALLNKFDIHYYKEAKITYTKE